MVSELKSLGIKSKTVLKALNNVPRHLFMDPGLISHSYKNKAFQIESGQTIMKGMGELHLDIIVVQYLFIYFLINF